MQAAGLVVQVVRIEGQQAQPDEPHRGQQQQLRTDARGPTRIGRQAVPQVQRGHRGQHPRQHETQQVEPQRVRHAFRAKHRDRVPDLRVARQRHAESGNSADEDEGGERTGQGQ